MQLNLFSTCSHNLMIERCVCKEMEMIVRSDEKDMKTAQDKAQLTEDQAAAERVIDQASLLQFVHIPNVCIHSTHVDAYLIRCRCLAYILCRTVLYLLHLCRGTFANS